MRVRVGIEESGCAIESDERWEAEGKVLCIAMLLRLMRHVHDDLNMIVAICIRALPDQRRVRRSRK